MSLITLMHYDNRNITTIKVVSTQIPDKEFIKFIKATKQIKSLTSLHLVDMKMETYISELYHVLHRHFGIRKLDLRNN